MTLYPWQRRILRLLDAPRVVIDRRRRRFDAITSVTIVGTSGNFPAGTPLRIGTPEPIATVWILGESDDHLEAAFTTEAAATVALGAKQAPIIARYGDSWEQYSHWWIEEIPLDPSTFGHGLGTAADPENTKASEPCGPEADADERT